MNMYLDWEWHFIEGGRVIARTKVLHFALVYLILSTTRIVMLAQAAVLFNGHEEEEHSGGKADHDQVRRIYMLERVLALKCIGLIGQSVCILCFVFDHAAWSTLLRRLR